MSSFLTVRPSPSSVWSTAAAGTISQIARGGLSLATRSSSEEAATAPVSRANASRLFAVVVYTMTSWPPRIKRRVMLPPILPRQIIPSCMPVTPSRPPTTHDGRLSRCSPLPQDLVGFGGHDGRAMVWHEPRRIFAGRAPRGNAHVVLVAIFGLVELSATRHHVA